MRAITWAAAWAVITIAAATFAESPMVRIAGGSYPIGSAAGRESAMPPHTVTLGPFLIDAHEVSNAQFAAFLNSLRVTTRSSSLK